MVSHVTSWWCHALQCQSSSVSHLFKNLYVTWWKQRHLPDKDSMQGCRPWDVVENSVKSADLKIIFLLEHNTSQRSKPELSLKCWTVGLSPLQTPGCCWDIVPDVGRACGRLQIVEVLLHKQCNVLTESRTASDCLLLLMYFAKILVMLYHSIY